MDGRELEKAVAGVIFCWSYSEQAPGQIFAPTSAPGNQGDGSGSSRKQQGNTLSLPLFETACVWLPLKSILRQLYSYFKILCTQYTPY